MVNDFGFESNLLSIIIALFQFPAAEVMFVNSSLHVFVLHLKTTRCGLKKKSYCLLIILIAFFQFKITKKKKNLKKISKTIF